MKKWSSWVAEKLWWKKLAVEAWWVPTWKVGFCPGMKKLQICDVAERVDRLGKKKGQLKKSSPREGAASLRIWSASVAARESLSLSYSLLRSSSWRSERSLDLQLLEVPMVMLWTPLAFGVTMLLCFTIFFFYCWRMRHSRTHAALTSSSIQVSATIPAAAAADFSQQQQLPVSTLHTLLSLF